MKRHKEEEEDLLLAGRQEEMSKFQVSHIENKSQEHRQEVNFVRNMGKQWGNSSKKTAQTCRNCDGEWPHTKTACPAQGKTCRACGKLNHFAKQCRSKMRSNDKRASVKPLTVTSNSDSECEQDYCYTVSHGEKKHPKVNIFVNGINMRFLVDTGSSINVIGYETFQKLKSITLKRTTIQAFPFNSKEPVELKEKFETTMESGRKFTIATIYVTEKDGGCLLSAETAQDLGLVKLHLNVVQEGKARTTKLPDQELQELKDPQDLKITSMVTKYNRLFQGLGKLQSKEIELCVDKDMPPVAQRKR